MKKSTIKKPSREETEFEKELMKQLGEWLFSENVEGKIKLIQEALSENKLGKKPLCKETPFEKTLMKILTESSLIQKLLAKTPREKPSHCHTVV